jgi:hypothetical protein
MTMLLAACSSGGSSDASPSSTTAASSSSAAPNTSASLEAGVKRDCLTAALDYVPLKTALAGSDADLTSAMQFIQAADADTAGETQQGKDAELALAQLGVDVATGNALATFGKTPDRAALQKSFSAAATACQPFGAAF